MKQIGHFMTININDSLKTLLDETPCGVWYTEGDETSLKMIDCLGNKDNNGRLNRNCLDCEFLKGREKYDN